MNLKKQYELSWKYVKKSKNFIYIVLGIFVLFSLIGFLFPTPESISEKIIEYIKELLEKTKGFNSIQIIWFIFINNVFSSFLGLFLGIIFGVFPIVSSLSNGYLLGFVASTSVAENGFLSLWRLFPHGIFELFAVFISLGMGLKLGLDVFKKKEIFLNNLKESVRVFVFIVFPLLVLAAIIEGLLISLF